MKLVTGIEAIQSGKRFRYVYVEAGSCATYSEWSDRVGEIPIGLKFSSILERSWQIEQEPREFWLCLTDNGHFRAWRTDPPEPDSVVKWIKVREVIE